MLFDVGRFYADENYFIFQWCTELCCTHPLGHISSLSQMWDARSGGFPRWLLKSFRFKCETNHAGSLHWRPTVQECWIFDSSSTDCARVSSILLLICHLLEKQNSRTLIHVYIGRSIKRKMKIDCTTEAYFTLATTLTHIPICFAFASSAFSSIHSHSFYFSGDGY